MRIIRRAEAKAIREAGGKKAWYRQIERMARELEKDFALRDRLVAIITEAPVIMNDDAAANTQLEKEVRAAIDRYSKRAHRRRRR